MSEPNQGYNQLIAAIKEIALINSCQGLLRWDERTKMPPKGAKHRSNQCGLLARIAHERLTSPETGKLVEEVRNSSLAADDSSETGANIREIAYMYDKAVKVPKEWVEEFTRATTMAQSAWIEARKKSQFALFLPHLKTLIDLRKQYADMIGYKKDRYDALIDDFEVGGTYDEFVRVFQPVRDMLVDLIAKIAASSIRPDMSILTRHYPIDAQEKFAREASAAIGYDYQGGRLDVTTHPFCSTIGPGDVRLTTRYDEHFFPTAFFGVVHEAGHGVYNQNLPEERFGTPLGSSVSLGIHESQSRMWENMVGRHRNTWNFLFPKAQGYFPQALAGVDPQVFYFAINDVKPSFIRIEADEVTYGLHIILRFELEHALVSGEIKPEDIPSVWNERFTKYFGITPGSDADGCLQDIHWSGGMFGYFPTYLLGSMNAAQFYEQACKEIPDLEDGFSRGDFAPLRKWLTEKIYRHGKLYRAGKLMEVVTGRPLSPEPFARYLKSKFGPLYKI